MTLCSAGTFPLKTSLTWCAIYMYFDFDALLRKYRACVRSRILQCDKRQKAALKYNCLLQKRERNGVVFIYWRKLATAPVEIKSETISGAHTSCTFNRLEPKRQSIARSFFFLFFSEWASICVLWCIHGASSTSLSDFMHHLSRALWFVGSLMHCPLFKFFLLFPVASMMVCIYFFFYFSISLCVSLNNLWLMYFALGAIFLLTFCIASRSFFSAWANCLPRYTPDYCQLLH